VVQDGATVATAGEAVNESVVILFRRKDVLVKDLGHVIVASGGLRLAGGEMAVDEAKCRVIDLKPHSDGSLVAV
jgi:hypothetical protein